MNYFSEKLKKLYDDEAALKLAEKDFDLKAAKEVALREERKDRAKEVTDKYKEYLDLRDKFIKDYGSWHMSLTEKDLPEGTSIFDLVDWFRF